MSETVAERLRYHRKRARLSQGQLAAKAHVSKGLVQNIEGSKGGPPRMSSLLKLADAMEIHVSELVGNATEAGLMPMLPEYLRITRDLKDHEIAAVVSVVEAFETSREQTEERERQQLPQVFDAEEYDDAILRAPEISELEIQRGVRQGRLAAQTPKDYDEESEEDDTE